MKKRINIPKIPHAFFKWYCKQEKYEEIHGDLEEFFYERAEEKGLFRARLFYFWNVIRCFQPYAWKMFESETSNMAMFRNFYFTTIRNLARHKSYFVINVSGLAIGIASFAFISMYIINELSYDRFHADHERIYRANTKALIRGQVNDDADSSAPLVTTMLEKYPEVIVGTRVHRSGQLLIGKEEKRINEEGVLFADENFFKVFDFELVKGNSETALENPRSMILTESFAKKYFAEEDPIGQVITVDEDSIFYEITGVIKDVPPNSHIQFDMLGSLSSTSHYNSTRWIGSAVHSYVKLSEGTDADELAATMKELFYLHMAPEIEYYTGLTIEEWEEAGNSVGYQLTPINRIHLFSESAGELEPTGNISYIYMYGIIAFIILFIAIFNFVNLATAHSSTRAKEVGVRKVIGSSKRTLVYQFIFESILIALISALVGFIIIYLFMPSFVNLIGNGVAYDITTNPSGWPLLVGLAIGVGLMAGFYPSIVLSAFKPVDVLKGSNNTKGKGWLRNALVTIQFTAAIIIMIGTLVVYNQLDYMLTRNLGFDKDQILVLERPDWLGKNLEVFKNDLMKNSDIKVVANSETLPGKKYQIRSYRKKGENEVYLFLNNQVTYEHLDLMGLELVAGRFFSKEFASDSNAVVLNESAAREFGFVDPVGQPLISAFKEGQINVIGIVKDYHVESLHKGMASVSLELLPNNADGFISIKIGSTENVRRTMGFIEDTWVQHTNGKPLQYFFFDQDYENLYKSETSTGKILLVFATLSVFIASMGLIGLITYTSTIRRKEVGIRKVLGASTTSLVRLLSYDIVKLIFVATAIAWPLSYFATDYWLQNFADRTSISPWIYVGATVAVFVVVGAAISFQTIKTSTSDPVDSLRQE